MCHWLLGLLPFLLVIPSIAYADLAIYVYMTVNFWVQNTNFFLENVIFNQCNVFEYASLFWGIVV